MNEIENTGFKRAVLHTEEEWKEVFEYYLSSMWTVHDEKQPEIDWFTKFKPKEYPCMLLKHEEYPIVLVMYPTDYT